MLSPNRVTCGRRDVPIADVGHARLNAMEHIATATGPTAQSVLQPGTIVRLNLDAGFGYVRDASAENCFIFVVGLALKHSQMRKLSVGSLVMFRVSGQGRVDELHAL